MLFDHIIEYMLVVSEDIEAKALAVTKIPNADNSPISIFFI